jgi:hypothetical protein
MVIDGGGDPVDFLFKKYNKKSKSFTLNNESEAARIERVQMIRLRYNNGIEGINQVKDLDLIARAKKSIKKLPEGLYDSLNVRARKHEPLSNEELFTVESELSKMNTDDATFVVGFIAKNYSRICLDPGIGQEPQPRTLQHILATRQNAINWWVRLMGTPYEKYAKYELARIYIASKEEDKAMELYRSIKVTPGLPIGEIDNVDKRMLLLGAGKEIYNHGVELFNEGKYMEAYYEMEKFRKSSSGIVYADYEWKARMTQRNSMLALCKMTTDKASRDKYMELARKVPIEEGNEAK